MWQKQQWKKRETESKMNHTFVSFLSQAKKDRTEGEDHDMSLYVCMYFQNTGYSKKINKIVKVCLGLQKEKKKNEMKKL